MQFVKKKQTCSGSAFFSWTYRVETAMAENDMDTHTVLGWGLIGYVKSKPLRSGQIISIDVLVVVMIIAVFHEKLI